MKDIGQNWSKHLADEYEQNGYWEPLTLGQHLRIWGQKYKKHTAIVDKSKRMTYDELDQRADELAIGFHQIGIRPGNRVLLQLPNSTNFIVSCFALFRLGSIPTLSMMANGTTDIDAFCTLAEPVAYITVNKFLGFDYYALAQKMKSQHRCLKHIIIDSESSDADYELNSLGGTSTVDLFPPHYRDTALLLLSGGTTGAPKLIPRTHTDYAYNAKASAKRCKLNFKSVYLAALPIAHNFPLACPGILGTLSVGGTVVLSRTPNYDETFPLIANERVTITSLVPPLVNIWLQACEWENSDLSSLSILQVGGSPLEDSVATKIKPVLGCQLQQVFGMAEGLLCFTELDAPDSVVLHTQGKPLSADDEIKIVDAWSLFLLLRNWCDLYDNPDLVFEKHELSFRDYVLALGKIHESSLYQRDKEFTINRLSELPPFPALPMVRSLGSVKKPRFRRYSASMDRNRWEKLKIRATQDGLTPSGILLGIYSLVLSHYSKGTEFTLNLTLFNRFPIHDQVNQIIGDFTSLTLLAVKKPNGEALLEWIQQLQYELWKVVEHRYFSGVDMIREFAAQNNNSRGATFPIVFTSALGYDEGSDEHSTLSRMGDFVYGITQTPQVALDHQVMEKDGDLLYNWDVVESLFPDDMIEEMFEAYGMILEMLSDIDTSWRDSASKLVAEVIPDKNPDYNTTNHPIPATLLHKLFDNKAVEHPLRPAIVASDVTIDYGTLRKHAHHLGGLLFKEDVHPGDLVAVIMSKSWEQVLAVLGILNSGAAYLPLDPDLPEARISHILQHAGVDIVLTKSTEIIHQLLTSLNVKIIDVDLMVPEETDDFQMVPIQRPEDLAYVIYTSGSTGLPKGVMIDHKGATNTILDINDRFDIGSNDKVFALSELSFDLSVYDIFGTLAAGGTIVMPDPEEKKDPVQWMRIIQETGVTIWNSVPMLMQMLTEHASSREKMIPPTLRLVLLSGDWIPLYLPEKIRALSKKVQLISLGGATEASIWSIIYPIGTVIDDWESIPYGWPMRNQKYYVLNNSMQKCPHWVCGDLYIGGIGLAKGYLNDTERTNNSFINHPGFEEPLYYTGDLGCYHPDGYINFMGRDDYQVKVGGYRIELGEIENTLRRHPQVDSAVAKIITSDKRDALLVAYIVLTTEDSITSKHLKTYLRQQIPQYMIPNDIVQLEKMPLSINGKVDRNALPKPNRLCRDIEQRFHPPQTDMEELLCGICQNIINLEKMDVEISFFDQGAGSLHLVQIQNELKDRLNFEVSIVDLFEYPTIRSLVEHFTAEKETSNLLNASKRASQRQKVRNRRLSLKKEKNT